LNETTRFLGDPAGWAKAQFHLDDWHGLWGGRRFFLSGRGPVVVQCVPPAQHESCYALTLPPAEAAALFFLAGQQDLLAVTFPARPLVPDETQSRLTLINAAGEARTVVKNGRDRHAGWAALYTTVLDVERRAQQTAALYTGPFRQAFQPEWD